MAFSRRNTGVIEVIVVNLPNGLCLAFDFREAAVFLLIILVAFGLLVIPGRLTLTSDLSFVATTREPTTVA